METKKSSSFRITQNVEIRPVVERPPNYWIELYTYHKNPHLRKILFALLHKDLNIYREIIEKLSGVEYVVFNDIKSSHWILGYNHAGGTLKVISHEHADILLHNWIHFYRLPCKLPDGTDIKTIKNFDQLLAYMTQFNPYWLLEISAYCLSGKSFVLIDPNPMYDYRATAKQINNINQHLIQLLETLDESSDDQTKH